MLRSDGLDPVAILVRSRREIEQGLNLFERKAQLACAPHESGALDVLRPVVAVGTLAWRRADNANAFVVPDGLDVASGQFRHLANFQVQPLESVVATD